MESQRESHTALERGMGENALFLQHGPWLALPQRDQRGLVVANTAEEKNSCDSIGDPVP